jgi:hypothetical protein
MSRSYKNIRPKKHFVYNVEGLMHLYGVARNTITNWVAEGLRRSDSFTPHVFNGAEVKRFHESKRLASKATLRIGQFKCFKCKERVFPDLCSLDLYPTKNGSAGVWAMCPNCKCVVVKVVGETDRDKILNCVITNTTLMSLDEEYERVPVGIGKKDPSETTKPTLRTIELYMHGCSLLGATTPKQSAQNSDSSASLRLSSRVNPSKRSERKTCRLFARV